ncbi:hypothetical protein GOP47_0006288 [Adiantum capillus-veneris]|nr:hypothetical protein GOP47_0006288 [Adiantum capillus-veneris]
MCPGVPTVPLLGLYVNMFLFAQLHWEGWVRFVILGSLSVGFYALYGQYNAKHEPLRADGYTYLPVDTQERNPDEAQL